MCNGSLGDSHRLWVQRWTLFSYLGGENGLPSSFSLESSHFYEHCLYLSQPREVREWFHRTTLQNLVLHFSVSFLNGGRRLGRAGLTKLKKDLHYQLREQKKNEQTSTCDSFLPHSPLPVHLATACTGCLDFSPQLCLLPSAATLYFQPPHRHFTGTYGGISNST